MDVEGDYFKSIQAKGKAMLGGGGKSIQGRKRSRRQNDPSKGEESFENDPSHSGRGIQNDPSHEFKSIQAKTLPYTITYNQKN